MYAWDHCMVVVLENDSYYRIVLRRTGTVVFPSAPRVRSVMHQLALAANWISTVLCDRVGSSRSNTVDCSRSTSHVG